MADTDYDVIVIGSGPGGYVAAIRAGQLGLKTACVESRDTLGGTCLNVGCIPSKALLHASELFEEANHGALAKFGVKIGSVELDLDTMHAEKAKAVKELTGGIAFLFKKNKVDWLKGHAAFTGQNSIDVAGKSYTAKNIVIATGSSVTSLPGVAIDNEVVIDSTGALALPHVPGHLVVIGGGVIGLELGSVWKRLGAKVTVVEYMDEILPGMDGEVRKEARKIFKKQGFEIRTSTKVTGVERVGAGATPHRRAGGRRRGGADPGGRGAGLDRPAPQHRRSRARACRHPGQQSRPDRSRSQLPHESAGGLGDRRRDARPDARPQGRGRRHCRFRRISPARRAS
jgi:dihydrolipoamide dehydrogenase